MCYNTYINQLILICGTIVPFILQSYCEISDPLYFLKEEAAFKFWHDII